MKKRICIIAVLTVCVLLLLIFMNREKGVESALERIGAGEMEEYSYLGEDTHGGFHGDGVAYYEIVPLMPEQMERVVQTAGWQQLPLVEECVWNTIRIILDDLAEKKVVEDAELVQRELESIKYGYWFFLDKQRTETKEAPDFEKTYNASSQNLVVAICDMETNTIYYFELDT